MDYAKGEEANTTRSGATVARTGSGYAAADDVDQLRCPARQVRGNYGERIVSTIHHTLEKKV